MTNMNSRKLLLLGALVLVCAAAIVRLGGSIYSFNKFQRAHLTSSSASMQAKDTSNSTEVPDVDFARLTEIEKQEARQHLNDESCTCGCKLTLLRCRFDDSSCPVSKILAAEVVDQVRAGRSKSTDRRTEVR
jgi:hypothetical protein